MIHLRRARDRGRSSASWLDSRHTFSFAHYLDLDHMGFGSLRVVNDDRVDAGAGFGAHSHRDMEIVTVVLDGEIEHRDSGGHATVVGAGGVQLMGAGHGVMHSEMNASSQQPLHFLQIWIQPRERGLEPVYDERPEARPAAGEARWIVAPDGRDGALRIRQDAAIEWLRPRRGDRVKRPLPEGRRAWLHVITGGIEVAGHRLGPGDGAGLEGESALDLGVTEDSELLIFELA